MIAIRPPARVQAENHGKADPLGCGQTNRIFSPTQHAEH